MRLRDVPNHDGRWSGQIVDIYGRKTRDDLRKGTPLHMHLSDERRGVWNVEAFQAGNEIILCASLFDALTFWNAGYRNVTCTFGPDALTDDHLAAFREFGIRRVLAVAAAVAPKLLAAGLDCYLLGFPPGHGREQPTPCKPPIRRRHSGQSSARLNGWARANRPCRCRPWKCPRRPPCRAKWNRTNPKPTMQRTNRKRKSWNDDEWDEMEDEADDFDDEETADASPPAVPPVPAPILAASPFRHRRKRSKPT